MNAPTRTEFLARRAAGIGGSDLAALLGLSPYKTAFQLWQEKTGRFEASFGPEQEERMHWGTALEDVVARHYAEHAGCKVQRINAQLVHPQYPCLLGNVDRVVVADGSRARYEPAQGRVLGAQRVLEVKTASAYALRSNGQADESGWGEAGTDQVPQHYWLQVQHYMGLTGLPVADVAVLFGGQTYRTYTVPAMPDLAADLFAQAADWWLCHVVADVPPNPTNETEARLAWGAHHPGKTVLVGADVAEKVAELRRVKQQMAALEAQEQALRDAVLPLVGDAEAITHMGQTLATWKASKPTPKTDWKAAYLDLGPTPEHTQQFTTTPPGARVLRLVTPKE